MLTCCCGVSCSHWRDVEPTTALAPAPDARTKPIATPEQTAVTVRVGYSPTEGLLLILLCLATTEYKVMASLFKHFLFVLFYNLTLLSPSHINFASSFIERAAYYYISTSTAASLSGL